MKKKIIIIVLIIIVLILVGAGFFIWNTKHKEAVSFCESDCKYRLDNWRYSSDDPIVFALTFYHTKKECVNACIDFNYYLRAF